MNDFASPGDQGAVTENESSSKFIKNKARRGAGFIFAYTGKMA
jgi:hypothetical protein